MREKLPHLHILLVLLGALISFFLTNVFGIQICVRLCLILILQFNALIIMQLLRMFLCIFGSVLTDNGSPLVSR